MMEPSAPVSNTVFQMGNALGVAMVSSVAFSRTNDVLATDPGTNPLVALTEGFQSGFLACALLAGVGLALALLLLGPAAESTGRAGRARAFPGARGRLRGTD
jgi:hypothetical protein